MQPLPQRTFFGLVGLALVTLAVVLWSPSFKSSKPIDLAREMELVQLRSEIQGLKHKLLESKGETPGHTYKTPFHYYFETFRMLDIPLAFKWEPFFEPYHRHFGKWRGQEVYFVEIGVQSGGSSLMWRWYFGSKLHYIGIDINPATQQFQNDWATILIGDQGNATFWGDFKTRFPRVDILLDDGGHFMQQQILTFQEMFPYVHSIYVCEDLHTSYWEKWQGNVNPEVPTISRRSQSMMEYLKQVIDWQHLNRWSDSFLRAEDRETAMHVRDYAKGISFYESMVFIEKERTSPPDTIRAGTYAIAVKQEQWNGKTFNYRSADVRRVLTDDKARRDEMYWHNSIY